jgi:hypothetical protein
MIRTRADDVIPSKDWLQGWTVTRNGIPVWYCSTRELAERYATDADYRASLIATKYAYR